MFQKIKNRFNNKKIDIPRFLVIFAIIAIYFKLLITDFNTFGMCVFIHIVLWSLYKRAFSKPNTDEEDTTTQ